MSKLSARTTHLPAGGGAFHLETTTIGVFLNDQPRHRLALGQDRAQVLPLSAQQGWIMPSGAEGICEFDRPLDFLTVSIDDEMLSDLGLRDPASLKPLVGAMDPVLLAMALQAEQFGEGGTLYRETMARAMAAHLLQTAAPAQPNVAALEDQRLRRVADYITAHLETDLSVRGMAALAGMSDAHFTRAFKAATGQSPLQYVIAERMALAGVLLRSTQLPVSEIAHRAGYGDLSRFGRHFKRHFGHTPARYRDE